MREERLLDADGDREDPDEARLPPLLDAEDERLAEPPELVFLFCVEAISGVLLFQDAAGASIGSTKQATRDTAPTIQQ